MGTYLFKFNLELRGCNISDFSICCMNECLFEFEEKANEKWQIEGSTVGIIFDGFRTWVFFLTHQATGE